jgi:hypothetical protein
MLFVTVLSLPVLVLLSQLVIDILLLVRLGAPLGRHFLAQIAEGDVWIFCSHALPPLVQKVHVAAERLLGCAQAFRVAPLPLRPAAIFRLVLVRRHFGGCGRFFARHLKKRPSQDSDTSINIADIDQREVSR